VHDFDRPRCRERARKRREVRQCQRIHAARVAPRRHLHQAKLGPIGPLTQKFSVEPDSLERREMRAKLGEGCR